MGINNSCLGFTKNKIDTNCDDDDDIQEYDAYEISIVQKQWSVVMRNCDTYGYRLFEK